MTAIFDKNRKLIVELDSVVGESQVEELVRIVECDGVLLVGEYDIVTHKLLTLMKEESVEFEKTLNNAALFQAEAHQEVKRKFLKRARSEITKALQIQGVEVDSSKRED